MGPKVKEKYRGGWGMHVLGKKGRKNGKNEKPSLPGGSENK